MREAYRVLPTKQKGYKFRVEWTARGKRFRKFFPSEKKAKAWAEEKNLEVYQSGGTNTLQMSERLRVESLLAEEIVKPFGKSIVDAAKFAAIRWTIAGRSRTVAAAIPEFLAAKKRDKKRDRYLQDLKSRLKQFSEQFGPRTVSEIETIEVRQWIAGLNAAPVTRNNMRTVLSAFWQFCLENGWCQGNIIRDIGTASTPAKEIGILTPTEAAKLLYFIPRRAIAVLAIGLFCGLRRSELSRLEKEHIKLKSGLVQVSVRKTGVGRRFVKIRQNLRAWLLAFPLQSLSEQQFKDDLDTARKGAGIDKWPANALRHSFCSYCLAREQNMNVLALEMGHTNPHTLFAHYRELVTPEDAALYWRLTPARVKMMVRLPQPAPTPL